MALRQELLRVKESLSEVKSCHQTHLGNNSCGFFDKAKHIGLKKFVHNLETELYEVRSKASRQMVEYTRKIARLHSDLEVAAINQRGMRRKIDQLSEELYFLKGGKLAQRQSLDGAILYQRTRSSSCADHRYNSNAKNISSIQVTRTSGATSPAFSSCESGLECTTRKPYPKIDTKYNRIRHSSSCTYGFNRSNTCSPHSSVLRSSRSPANGYYSSSSPEPGSIKVNQNSSSKKLNNSRLLAPLNDIRTSRSPSSRSVVKSPSLSERHQVYNEMDSDLRYEFEFMVLNAMVKLFRVNNYYNFIIISRFSSYIYIYTFIYIYWFMFLALLRDTYLQLSRISLQTQGRMNGDLVIRNIFRYYLENSSSC
ncbi:hypothetical protein Smp_150420 [Schistosoma mansoni]|uniref:hypothetical protein n=1 Tax=Schistosoma mansoni TaxID=6183 RepID=UPI00022DC5D8|nr:hypothetical protein Smp_150420 [Schistosoma mansoni]|eukprot:XP_018648376.1 hypothetical protein Smp_150420 [Schistosoma mansoni]